MSRERLWVPQIARELGCADKTVRYRLARFNAEGLDGLGDRSGAGPGEIVHATAVATAQLNTFHGRS